MSDKLDNTERQYLVNQVLDATTLVEIEEATQALDAWLESHPDDVSIQDGYEQLALMKNAMLALEAESQRLLQPQAVSASP